MRGEAGRINVNFVAVDLLLDELIRRIEAAVEAKALGLGGMGGGRACLMPRDAQLARPQAQARRGSGRGSRWLPSQPSPFRGP